MPVIDSNKDSGNKKADMYLTDHELDDVQNLASAGFSIQDIAEFLYIADQTFRKMLKKSKENCESFKGDKFRKAEFLDQEVWFRFKQGQRMQHLMVSQGITKEAIEGNTQVLLFLARTKLGWNDKLLQTEEHSAVEELSKISISYEDVAGLPEGKE